MIALCEEQTKTEQSSLLWCFSSFLELDHISPHSLSLYGKEQREDSGKIIVCSMEKSNASL